MGSWGKLEVVQSFCYEAACWNSDVYDGGQNSSVGSVLGWLSCLMQYCWFNPPRSLLIEGIFPLVLTLVLTTLSDESINRGPVCAHTRSIVWIQKIVTFMSWMGDWQHQKHTQHAPFTKMECDHLCGEIKKRLHMQISHPMWWTPEI